MVLVGKGEDGIRLMETTKAIRELLREGKSDEEAEQIIREKK